jgi:hypothetical protein
MLRHKETDEKVQVQSLNAKCDSETWMRSKCKARIQIAMARCRWGVGSKHWGANEAPKKTGPCQ